MPVNPSRSSQGGDVEGETSIFVSQGEAIKVSKASYDPGYDLTSTMSDAGVKVAKSDLIKGYCTYGQVVGEY